MPAYLLGLYYAIVAQRIPRQRGEGCSHAHGDHEGEIDQLEENGLGVNVLRAEEGGHDDEEFVGPPLRAEHENRRHSEAEEVAPFLEGGFIEWLERSLDGRVAPARENLHEKTEIVTEDVDINEVSVVSVSQIEAE